MKLNIPYKEETTTLYIRGCTVRNKLFLTSIAKKHKTSVSKIINHWVELKRRGLETLPTPKKK